MERCALQGFRAEPLAGMSKSGVLRATGNAMSTPVVAAAFKRCMEVLAARMSVGVPSTIQPPDKKRARRRRDIKLMQEHIALLEAEESVLRRLMPSQAIVSRSACDSAEQAGVTGFGHWVQGAEQEDHRFRGLMFSSRSTDLGAWIPGMAQ